LIKKRLLIITYYWPPLGGPGSLRPLKFARYLPEFDIEPIILTRKDIAYHNIDNDLLGDAKNLIFFKTESLDPARILYILGMRIYQPKSWHRPIKEAINFPDHKIFWIPFAYAAGLKIRVDYILATAPPFSAFIGGYLISKKLNIPLILDFRDAWLEFPFMPYRSKLKKKFVGYWEHKISQYASQIIVVDENIRKTLISRYPEMHKKISVIPNGYDPNDFFAVASPDVFTISYLGTIRRERNPETFLQAIERLILAGKISMNELKVKFIGNIEEGYLKRRKKRPFCEIYGHLPYRRAIREFCASHLAIMITTGNEFFFPSRQNEYLASGLPIIVCGESRGIHLLEAAFKNGYPGWIFRYDDVEGMANKILDIYKKFKSGKRLEGKTPYPNYTRRELTRKLANLIQDIQGDTP
jgi:glycosyltransferase involved in cell wall biosynthesis